MVHYKRKPKQTFLIDADFAGKRFPEKVGNWVWDSHLEHRQGVDTWPIT